MANNRRLRFNFVSLKKDESLSEDLQNAITFQQFKKELEKFKLKSKQLFNDMFIFSNQFLEIAVWLNSEDNYYDERPRTVDLKTYTGFVQLITIDILKSLNNEQIFVIKSIMDKFGLLIVVDKSVQYFYSIEEFCSFLKDKQLYK